MCFEQRLDRYRPVPFYFLTTTDPVEYTEEAVCSTMQRRFWLRRDRAFNKPPLGFFAGVIFLHEKNSDTKMAGLILIFAGLLMVSFFK